MAKVSKRFLAALSLFILLQQFVTVFAGMCHDKQKRDFSGVDYSDQENAEIKGKIANKIFGTFLKKAWRLLGKKSFIGKINFATDFTETIAGILSNSDYIKSFIENCGDLTATIKANWDEYERLVREFQKLSENIDKENLQAQSRQIYVNASFYEYRRSRVKLRNIAREQENILKAFGSEEAQANNTMDEKRDSINLLSGLGQRLNSIGLTNIKFDMTMQNIGNTIKPKLTSASKGFKGISKRIAPLTRLFMASWSIWSLVTKSREKKIECKAIAKKSQKSVQKMGDMLQNAKEMYQTAKKSNNDVQEAFDDVYKHTIEKTLLDTIWQLQNMTSDPLVARQSDDSVQGIVVALKQYITSKDIETNDENKKKLSKLQRDLNEALHQIPFILNCHIIRGQFINVIKTYCYRGDGSLVNIYQQATRVITVDDNNCNERIGDLFPPLEQIKPTLEEWVKNNKTFNKVCLMNNQRAVDAVKEQLQNGLTDPKKIAEKVLQSDSVDEIKAMVEILKNDPMVKTLPMPKQFMICVLKDTKTYETAKKIVNADPEGRQVTKEEYDNQVCPPQLTNIK